MDTNIRSLLSSAKSCKGKDKTLFLQQAFTRIRSVFEARPAADGPEPFGQDLFVQCAEIAFEHGLKEITRDCLKMFFLKQQPTNQFLIRAYLCQAQLLAPQDANKPEELDKAVVYILKAISLAKQTDRYHFLVYNASVIYWHFCRPFLKPNFQLFLAQSLHQVVQALDETDDQDFEWRAQLMISLIECLLDAGQKADASSISTVGAAFIKKNVPHLYKQIFGLMVRYQLVELTKLNKEAKTSPELIIYYRICKLKCSLDLQEAREYQVDIINILTQMGVAVPQSAVYSQRSPHKKTPGRSTSPARSSRVETGTSRSASKGGRRTPTPTTFKALEDDEISKANLLMELAHLCLDLDLGKVASVCIEEIKTCTVKDQSFCIQVEFLECLLMVKSLGENQESYQKSVVDRRLQAIKRCEEAIMNAIRHGDPSVIQAGCVAQWNLCLPLLQPNLRHCIHKSLSLIAEALENIQSLLIKLRCQLHTELAKCEENKEQIQVAMEHLKKALALDDGNVYQERLEVMLRRLQLRSQLYRQPERPEDQAAMIIEQAQKADSGSVLMKRSMLIKAGEALAPDAFLLVLDSENESRDDGSIRGPLTFSKKLSAKARSFNHHVRKAEGHLKRLGKENDRERARLWADLAKTARKQGVWDVCRVAARFCLLYDDGRWKGSLPRPVSSKQERTKSDMKEKTEDDPDKKPGSRPLTPSKPVELYDRDLVRMLAEVNFINGEAIVLLLRSEGVQLNDKPIFPESHSKLPKGHIAVKPENDPHWLEYCDWIRELSEASTSSFLRGLELGVDLMEPWLVCSAAAYIWNYNNHVLTQMRHREILLPFTAVLDGLKRVGHFGETAMLVNICNALAYAFIQPWIPEAPKEEKDQSTPPLKDDLSKNKLKASGSQSKVKGSGVSLAPEATADIKKAVEVCEYAINLTSGEHRQDIIPIATRKLILQTWVMSKQMAQQQIGKTFGTDDESSTEGQKEMTRAIVATEMLSLNTNGIMEFKDVPSIADVAQMVENCQWTDSLIKLQLLTRLTSLAYHNHQHNLVMRCSKAALQLVSVDSHKGKNGDKHRYMVRQEMLAYATILQGQSLIDNMGGKHSLRRDAMEAFLCGASFARRAGNYDLVMTAARHYWNACIDLVSQPMERQLLKEPIKTILDCITATWDKKSKIEERVEEVALTEEPKKDDINKKDEKKKPATQTSSTADKQSDDLALRAAMYGVLFQSYADQGEWEMSLKAMDQAVAVMPRTKHRLLIFKHRVITKAKLGQSVQMDFQKFKDESEDYVAHMWRKVALCSVELSEQLSSYQNAIESLSSPSNEFQKVDYLLEFSQWLYYNHFPLQDVLDQVEWAIDILLNIQDEEAMQLKKEGTKPSTTALDSKKLSKAAKLTEKKKSKESALSKTSLTSLQKVPVVEESGKISTGGKHKILDGRLEVSDQETEINTGDFVPLAKEVVIGVLPSNPGLKIRELTNVRQLDALIRAHVLLAELTGQDGTCYADILLQAQGYLVRLWQVLIKEGGPAMKIVQQSQQEEGASKGKSSAKEKKSKDGKSESPVKEKLKRKGPLDAVPEAIEDWAVYSAPDELIEAFQHDSMKKSGLNVDTFPKPMLTMHYLDILTRQLRVLGYTHLALPVLAFQDLLSRSMLINHSLSILICARALEVCLELDLKAGCEFHENGIGNITISEKEQFRSREEIALWKEKKAQVAREEMRVKDSSARTAADSSSQAIFDGATLPEHAQYPGKAKDGGKTTASHVGKVLGAVCQREVWADLAEVLIRLGYLQKAREYLSEANIAAEAFSDTALQGQIMYLFGKLAFDEAQFGQAINFCKAAQEIHQGDEMFWFETMLLLVESVLCDYTNKNRRHLAMKLLAHALNEFRKITSERPNRTATLNFIMTTFEAKAASVQMQIILDHHKDINSPVAMKSVLTVCEKLDDCVEKLIRLGHRREAVILTIEHASYLTMLARAATEVQVENGYYLEALSVLKEAASLAEQVFFDALTLTSLQESQNLSFPVQRELANVYACQGELLVEVAALQVKEMRFMQLAEQRKGSIIRLVENYTRQSPLLSPTQKGWLSKRLTVFEEAMTVLINAHNLAGNITELKTKALAGLGKVLRILAEHKGPDPPSLWLVHEIEQLYQKADTEETEQEATEAGKIKDKEDDVLALDGEHTTERLSDEETRRFAKNSQLILSMKKQHEASKLYYVYATECLSQGLSLAIAKKHKALAGQIALDLVKCCGQFDPSLATQFLAFYQSCQTSLKLQELLYKAQRDPTLSRLAALLHQHRTLLRNNLSTNLGKSSVMTSVLNLLEKDFQAWKQLEILPNHLDILKEFPQNFNFVILQHSPDRDFLYGAVMDKPKSSGGGGGKSNARLATGIGASRARIFGVETDPKVLQNMIEKFQQHKQNAQAFLLKQECRRTQAIQRQKMLENTDVDRKLSERGPIETGDESQHLEEDFQDLVTDMENYLRPVMAAVDAALSSTSSKEVGSECFILLPDADLLELPLEALSCLQADSIDALTRDFSLQMLYHRMFQGVVTDAPPKEDAGMDKKKKKSDVPSVPSRIQGPSESKVKQSNLSKRTLLPWQVAVESSNIKYIVDPYREGSETEERKPVDQFRHVLDEYEQFTQRWLGIYGEDHTPSVGEWEVYIKESSAFLFYGFERLVAYLSPAKLSALNIPDCMLLYVLDQVQTNKSFMRQTRVDTLKSQNELALEGPLEMAMMVSLTGSKCVLANQWSCTLAENTNKLGLNMKDLLERGMSSGQTVRLLFSPPKRRALEERMAAEAAAAAAASAHQKAKGKDKDAKGSEKQKSRAGSDGNVISDDPDKDRESPKEQEEEKPAQPQRACFNMVCYGMPNLVIT